MKRIHSHISKIISSPVWLVVVILGSIFMWGISLAAPTQNVTITDPPTWCQAGNWTLGDFTYYGIRCVNPPFGNWSTAASYGNCGYNLEVKQNGDYVISTTCPQPTPTPTPVPIGNDSCSFLMCMNHLGNCTVVHGSCDFSKWTIPSEPTPTPTTTPDVHWNRDCMIYSQSCNDCSWKCSTWGYRNLDSPAIPPYFSPCPDCPQSAPHTQGSWQCTSAGCVWFFDIPIPIPTSNDNSTPSGWYRGTHPDTKGFYFGDVCPFPIQTFQDEQCTTTLYVYDYFGYKVFLTQGNCGISMAVVPDDVR